MQEHQNMSAKTLCHYLCRTRSVTKINFNNLKTNNAIFLVLYFVLFENKLNSYI